MGYQAPCVCVCVCARTIQQKQWERVFLFFDDTFEVTGKGAVSGHGFQQQHMMIFVLELQRAVTLVSVLDLCAI